MAVPDQLDARLSAWDDIKRLRDSDALDAAAVNAPRAAGLRVFYGGRGIWTDKARTSTLSSDGVTVGVLHTGRSYADDLLPDGIVYHYPHTTVPGRDAQEVGATKAAKNWRSRCSSWSNLTQRHAASSISDGWRIGTTARSSSPLHLLMPRRRQCLPRPKKTICRFSSNVRRHRAGRFPRPRGPVSTDSASESFDATGPNAPCATFP